MHENDKLTTQQFWTNEIPEFVFKRHEKGHGIDNIIKQYIPENPSGNCIEIGSYPGPHLATFGDMGYTLNGIDFHPGNDKDLPAWLQSLGYKIGEFQSVDFFEFVISTKFDVVASFGFIEHFKNYKEVIEKHASLVKDNGYLIITTPNFRGSIQRWLHKTFDENNLAIHNIESMQPKIWSKLLTDKGFKILFHSYFGDFWFWRSNEKMNVFKKRMLWIIERIIPRLRKIIWFQSPAFSAYCGVVARKIIKEGNCSK